MDREQFSSYAKRRSILYDTRAGSFISPDPRAHILSALQRSAVDGVLPRVIFAGEEHTHPLHHAMQYELIKAVNEIDDQPLMIGLEMCWRQHQRALDAFVFGDGSFEMLAKRFSALPARCIYDFLDDGIRYSSVLREETSDAGSRGAGSCFAPSRGHDF